jgi:N utilization substance protein A
MSEAIRQLMQERNMSEELIQKTIENTLLAAYKKTFGRDENAVVRFNDNQEVSILAKKTIVDDVYDSLLEIDLEEAKRLLPDAEIGDEILIEVDPKEFDRGSVQSAKQKAHQTIKEFQKDNLWSEFKDKVNEIVIGYYQRERNGDIYVDLGKIEGRLLKKYQSPREVYRVNDRIKALIVTVDNTKPGAIDIILSRTHPEFVKAIFELEVPEVYDKTVEIHKIVREPGYRTKLAVYSNREDVDPVGACVGLKGVRIQAIIKELEGEKIDILKYDPDPRRFIKNALSPADVRDVIIMDESKRQALAVVNENQLSLAIGKQGLNVRLANRLVDWSIDVKTDAQFEEMDIAAESRRAVSELFGEGEEYGEELSRISELPGVDPTVARVLLDNNIDFIEDFLDVSDEDLAALPGLNAEQIAALKKLIEEYVEIVEEEGESFEEAANEEETEIPAAEENTEEEYECPECGAKITVDMTNCPNCGVGLSFEDAEE